MATVTIGGVQLKDFEIPDKMPFGGKQELSVRKLPGGKRSIHPMGRDDADIPWSGRFRGRDALTRARQIDFMRIDGQPIELTWDTFRYKVLIASFTADYETTEIPYQITCVVVTDDNSPTAPGTAPSGLSAAKGNLSVLGDLTSDLQDGLTSIGTAINTIQDKFSQATAFVANLQNQVGPIALAVSSIQQSLSAVPIVGGKLSGFLTPIAAKIGAVQSTLETTLSYGNSAITGINDAGDLVSGTNSAINNVGGMVSGLAPSTLADNLTSQATAFSQSAVLHQTQDNLTVASKNLFTAALNNAPATGTQFTEFQPDGSKVTTTIGPEFTL